MQQYEEKYHMNTGLLQRGLRGGPSDGLKEGSQRPPWLFMQPLQQTDFWNPAFFTHVWLGLFTAISYVTSVQNCCKMWICRMGFINGLDIMMLHHINGSWIMVLHYIYGSCIMVLQHI